MRFLKRFYHKYKAYFRIELIMYLTLILMILLYLAWDYFRS